MLAAKTFIYKQIEPVLQSLFNSRYFVETVDLEEVNEPVDLKEVNQTVGINQGIEEDILQGFDFEEFEEADLQSLYHNMQAIFEQLKSAQSNIEKFFADSENVSGMQNAILQSYKNAIDTLLSNRKNFIENPDNLYPNQFKTDVAQHKRFVTPLELQHLKHLYAFILQVEKEQKGLSTPDQSITDIAAKRQWLKNERNKLREIHRREYLPCIKAAVEKLKTDKAEIMKLITTHNKRRNVLVNLYGSYPDTLNTLCDAYAEESYRSIKDYINISSRNIKRLQLACIDLCTDDVLKAIKSLYEKRKAVMHNTDSIAKWEEIIQQENFDHMFGREEMQILTAFIKKQELLFSEYFKSPSIQSTMQR